MSPHRTLEGQAARGEAPLTCVLSEETPGRKTPILLTLEFSASASHWPNPTGIKRAKALAPAARGRDIKDCPLQGQAVKTTGWVRAHAGATASPCSLPRVLAPWGSQRMFAEAALIRHIPERPSGPACLDWRPPGKGDRFQVLPIATRILCNIAAQAEGAVTCVT